MTRLPEPTPRYAVFLENVQCTKSHSTKIAAITEAMEMGLVQEFNGQTILMPQAEVKPVESK